MEEKRPACLGDEIASCTDECWVGEILEGGGRRITHVGDETRVFTQGVMPEGLCDAGHDVTLERWLHETSERAHAKSTAAVQVAELRAAGNALVAVLPSSADLRLLVRMIGGTSETAGSLINQYDEVDVLVDRWRSLVSEHAPSTA